MVQSPKELAGFINEPPVEVLFSFIGPFIPEAIISNAREAFTLKLKTELNSLNNFILAQ